MPSMPDLAPAARRMAALLANVPDYQLTAPTPVRTPLGALIDHVNGLALAFTWAATKDFPVGGSQPRSATRPASRRTGAPASPSGSTRSPPRGAPRRLAGHDEGGIDLPGDQAGNVALNELVVHGWDIARATGQPYDADEDEIESCLAFVAPTVEQSGGQGVPGLFGPAVKPPPTLPP